MTQGIFWKFLVEGPSLLEPLTPREPESSETTEGQGPGTHANIRGISSASSNRYNPRSRPHSGLISMNTI